MERTTDVFLCYRRAGAQTAKLFKKYLLDRNFPGDVWYSDAEDQGHLIEDVPQLIASAKSAVLFIDDNFTYNFKSKECITCIEIMEIVKRAKSDPNFLVFEIFLNRKRHEFTKKEESTLARALKNMDQHLEILTKRNARCFDVYRDDEQTLVDELAPQLLPPEYFIDHIGNGNFSFGVLPTHVDLAVCDYDRGLEAGNISFVLDGRESPLYGALERIPFTGGGERQNNTMISYVGADITLSDNEEKKIIELRYTPIQYELFQKTIKSMNVSSLGLRRMISEYGIEDEVFPVPNAMGVSFAVVTSDRMLLLAKRSQARRIRSGEYDVSVVEGLQTKSILQGGFVEEEIRRGYREEVCEDADDIEIRISALAHDKEYAQWNFIGTIFTKRTSADILRRYPLRRDSSERQDIFFVPYAKNVERDVELTAKGLAKYIHGGMWGMGLATLHSALRAIGFTEDEILQISR